MPYTKVTLVAEGAIMATITCNLETGKTEITDCTYLPQQREKVLSAYEPLRQSPCLEERRAFRVIQERSIDRFPACIRKKTLRNTVRLKLLELANDQHLGRRPPRFTGRYRDGWDVSIILEGAGEPRKTLGPFSSHDQESGAEQLINLISENERLFVDQATTWQNAERRCTGARR